MPVLILRPNGVPAGGEDSWGLDGGASKAAAVDPGDPISHDDNESVIRESEADIAQDFEFSNPPAGIGSINQVTAWIRWGNTDSSVFGNHGVKVEAILNGVVGDPAFEYYLAGTNNVNVFYTYDAGAIGGTTPNPPLLPRPGGGDWTVADLSGLQLRLTSLTNPIVYTIRVTSLWVEVDYTDPEIELEDSLEAGAPSIVEALELGDVPEAIELEDELAAGAPSIDEGLEVAELFETVVDAMVTAGGDDNWYSRFGSENIGSFTGDIEVGTDFDVDRIYYNPPGRTGELRLNRNPAAQALAGEGNDFDEVFGSDGAGAAAVVYVVNAAGAVAEIPVTDRRSIGPHYLNLSPSEASRTILDTIGSGDTFRFVIGPAGLSLATSTDPIELADELAAGAPSIVEALELGDVPEAIELADELAAGAPSIVEALQVVDAADPIELADELTAGAPSIDEGLEVAELFETVVDAMVTAGGDDNWYSRFGSENIGSFTGDIEVGTDFDVDRIYYNPTGRPGELRLNRSPSGALAGEGNDFDEVFGPDGAGAAAVVYVVNAAGAVAEIPVTDRRSIGPHYLNLSPSEASRTILDTIGSGDTFRFVIGAAGLSLAPSTSIELADELTAGAPSIVEALELGDAPEAIELADELEAGAPSIVEALQVVDAADPIELADELTAGAPSIVEALELGDAPLSIDSFAADSANIAAGASTTLRWATSQATAVTLDGVAVALDGSQVVMPAVTTTYQLQATRAGQVVSEVVTVTVLAAAAGILSATMLAELRRQDPELSPLLEVDFPGGTRRYQERVIHWPTITRSIGEDSVEAVTCAVEISDTDFAFSDLLDSAGVRALRGVEARILLLSPNVPLADSFTCFRGELVGVRPSSALAWSFDLRVRDKQLEQKYPKALVGSGDWPNVDATAVAEPVPVVFGYHNGAGIISSGLLPAVLVDVDLRRYMFAAGDLAVDSVFDGATQLEASEWSVVRPVVAGRLYTAVDLSADPAGAVTVNATGYEVADILTNPAVQLRHLLVNFVFGDWRSGEWLADASAPLALTHFDEAASFLAGLDAEGSRRIGDSQRSGYDTVAEWLHEHYALGFWTHDGLLAIRPDDPFGDAFAGELVRWERQPGKVDDFRQSFRDRSIVDTLNVEHIYDSSARKFLDATVVSDLSVGEDSQERLELYWLVSRGS